MMGALDSQEFTRRLTVSVWNQESNPDVMHVVAKSLAVTDVEILVVVLGQQPGTGTLTSVVLAVSRPDLDRQVLTGGLQREFDKASVASRSVVGDLEVTPNVEIGFDPVSPFPQLPGSQGRETNLPWHCRDSRSEIEGSRGVLAHDRRRRLKAQQSDDGLARDPVGPLGELD